MKRQWRMGEIQRLNRIPSFRDATGLSRAQHTSVFSCMIVSTDLRDPAHPQRQQGCVIHTHTSTFLPVAPIRLRILWRVASTSMRSHCPLLPSPLTHPRLCAAAGTLASCCLYPYPPLRVPFACLIRNISFPPGVPHGAGSCFHSRASALRRHGIGRGSS